MEKKAFFFDIDETLLSWITHEVPASAIYALEELKKKGVDAYYFPSFEEIENFFLENCKSGDMLITMGAGDVVNIGENLLKK